LKFIHFLKSPFLPWAKSLTIFSFIHPFINLNEIITPKTMKSTTQKSSQFYKKPPTKDTIKLIQEIEY